MDAKQALKNTRAILLIDWPNKNVLETLTRVGFSVFVHGGPGPEEYSVYELKGGEIIFRRSGRRPDHADLVYSYRPVAELAQTVDEAQTVDAKILSVQSGISSNGGRTDAKAFWMTDEHMRCAQGQVEAAGWELITQPYIGDLVRENSGPR